MATSKDMSALTLHGLTKLEAKLHVKLNYGMQ